MFEVRELGFASYLKVNGMKLKDVQEKMFIFEKDDTKSLKEWEIEYSNSCCSLHDREVMSLRKLLVEKRKDV